MIAYGKILCRILNGCLTPSGSGGAKGMIANGKILCRILNGCLTPTGSGERKE